MDFKTRLFKYCDLDFETRARLKEWSLRVDDLCDAHSLVRGIRKLDESLFENPTLRIAVVTNSTGQVVSFSLIQQAMLLLPQVHSPSSTEVERSHAGACLEGQLISEAAREGVSRQLFVVSNTIADAIPGVKWVPVLQRKVSPELIALFRSIPSDEDAPVSTRFAN